MDCLKVGVCVAVNLGNDQCQPSELHVKEKGRTLNNRTLRSAPVASRTGTCGEGWNWTTFIGPSDFAARFASRSRSIASVPGAITLDFLGPPKIPPVDVRSSKTTSSSSSGSESDPLRRFMGCSFFRALAAQSGVGFIFSNCLRSRRSYSRPPTASSVGASRSLRKRLSVTRETRRVVSSSSAHAADLRVGWTGAGASSSSLESDWTVSSSSMKVSGTCEVEASPSSI